MSVLCYCGSTLAVDVGETKLLVYNENYLVTNIRIVPFEIVERIKYLPYVPKELRKKKTNS